MTENLNDKKVLYQIRWFYLEFMNVHRDLYPGRFTFTAYLRFHCIKRNEEYTTNKQKMCLRLQKRRAICVET